MFCVCGHITNNLTKSNLIADKMDKSEPVADWHEFGFVSNLISNRNLFRFEEEEQGSEMNATAR